MREIKFRAWDTKKNRFDYEPLISRGECCYIDSFDNFNEYEEGRMILQQYTGLKDKNGKEIYEGDICVQSNDRKKGVYTVVWQDNGFKLEIIVRKTYGSASWNEKVHVPIFPNSYEIIGNIYENHELLEVTP